jgi:hypothetical protein
MPKTKSVKKLPDMTDWSDEQIHEFWKTHDSADFWEETEPVEIVAERPRQRAVSVKLDEQDIAKLKKIALRYGDIGLRRVQIAISG